MPAKRAAPDPLLLGDHVTRPHVTSVSVALALPRAPPPTAAPAALAVLAPRPKNVVPILDPVTRQEVTVSGPPTGAHVGSSVCPS